MRFLFKNKYDEIRSGWALFLSVIVLFIVILLVGFSVALITGNGAVRLFNTPFADYLLMSIAVLLLFWLIYKRPLKQMGLHSNKWFKQLMLGMAFGTILITLIIVIMLASGLIQFVDVNFNNLTNHLFWTGLLVFVGVGFFEELFARGFIMTVLKTTRNKWVILLLSSFIFGILHVANPSVTPFALINITLIGILIGYLFIKTGRLWAAIGIHFAWNFVQGNIFGSLVSGIDTISIVHIEVTGAEWLTGGEFGLEGGIICTFVVLLGLAYVHFCIKQNKNFWRIDSDMPLTRGL
ncbi:MAG: CPBP family intramembrane metalloprotease [Defluviitaleaceae bacterium]|nr:CPBP family intramembrane metalloprotease [Defluviitaleaceae bacterium]